MAKSRWLRIQSVNHEFALTLTIHQTYLTTRPPTFASSAKSTPTAITSSSPPIPLTRANQRVTITSNGLTAEASTFTPCSVYVNGVPYPAHYQRPQSFLKPNAAFAPRQSN